VSEALEVVAFLSHALVDDPEAVRVTEAEQGGTTVIELFVAPDDLGKVIGRQGRTAAALRTLAAAAGERHGRKVMLEIREPGRPGPARDR
jgi:predicted RNA-binding protein YlqC (UPF0109 family)